MNARPRSGDNVTADPHKVSERPNSGKPGKPLDRVLAVLAMRVPAAPKNVLVAIASCDGKNGAFPSQKYLAGLCCLSARRVRTLVKWLCDNGVVAVENTQRSNRYVVAYDWNPPNPTRNTGFRLGPESHPEPVHPAHPEHRVPPHPERGVPPNRKEPGLNRDRAVAHQGERPPYPSESTRANAPPLASPACGQSSDGASLLPGLAVALESQSCLSVTLRL